jgi:GH35 family endo-1,4-beta-xylanase
MGIGEYVRRAFAAARKANPAATLLINDYRMDRAYEKTVIAELVDDGQAMYDVIGLQSHMHGGYWGAKRAWEVCETFAKYEVPLHYTETTVVSGPKSGSGWVSTAEGEKAQAEAVAEFYTLLFSHPAVEAITWWDFTDQNAWQGAPAGLVRSDMTAKPAYERLMDLIKGKWWTKTRSQVKGNGRVGFEGFFGQYEVAASVNGRKLSGAFVLEEDSREPLEVRLS